ncbi:hypothetical protein ISN44_As10g002980 [Arabidopsis suecica]|uniref:Uncharacterized protein n=1 Tax=Arabidopsis suecica TaxID=45249 RepID=A0A8T1ZRS6_ARASU|nr:hypothetical protein ISN44_As10g002980 [Arabidopsis suecica]
MYSLVRGRQEKQKIMFSRQDKCQIIIREFMMKQYLFKITGFLKAPVTIGFALASAAVVAVVQQREFLMDIATKKKEDKAEKKNLKEEEAAEKSAANLKENAE